MKNIGVLLLLGSYLLIASSSSWAQSNPKIDRPVQQCINDNKSKIENLKTDFSIGYWLGKLIENCGKIQASSGRGGGPYVIAVLAMEKELDDLITLSNNCKKLGDPKVKQYLTDMKAIFEEKQEVETFSTDTDNDSLFDDDKEVTTYSLPRSAAGKIKSKAEKIKKLLKK